MAQARFDRPGLVRVSQAAARARELTGHHFGLSDDWFDRTSHQVCTRKDLRASEVLGDGRLACIRLLYRVLGEAPGRVLRCQQVLPHYRICLQDHNVLAWQARVPGEDLADLVTAVLTHEYVHLVRFARLEHPYRTREEAAGEEARVDTLTRQILERHGGAALRRVAAVLPARSRG